MGRTAETRDVSFKRHLAYEHFLSDFPDDRDRIRDADIVRFNVQIIALRRHRSRAALHQDVAVHRPIFKVDLTPGVIDGLNVFQGNSSSLGQDGSSILLLRRRTSSTKLQGDAQALIHPIRSLSSSIAGKYNPCAYC